MHFTNTLPRVGKTAKVGYPQFTTNKKAHTEIKHITTNADFSK